MGYIDSFVEGIAENAALNKAQNYVTDKFNEYGERNFQTKDPYRYETPSGESRKLKLRESATKEEQKMWKWVQKRAWLDDKCFMGCYPVDCGIGLGPLVVLIPCIGPFLMYAVHARLVTRAGTYYKLDSKTVAKLQANILFDLLISIPPVVGSFFTWMNGCSTRNAAIIHTEITKRLLLREQQQQQQQQHQQSFEPNEMNANSTRIPFFSTRKNEPLKTTVPTQPHNSPPAMITPPNATHRPML